LSINKEIDNTSKVANLQIANFSGLGNRIDAYNNVTAKSAEKQEQLRNTIPIDTFQAYTQTLGDNQATLEGYQKYLGQTATGFAGVRNAIANFNTMQSKGVEQQNAYAQAIGTGNTHLGQYLTNLNGAQATMGGYISSLFKAKVATIGLQAASIALNMALTMGISFAIQTAIKALSHLYNIQDKLSEKTKELTSNIKSANDEIKSNNSEIEDLNKKLDENASRYDELIRKKQESELTTEESKELEHIQNINAELLNQKNILEENNRLKKEQAAQDAQDLAELLLKQESVSVAMDSSQGKMLEWLTNFETKYLFPIAKGVDAISQAMHALGLISDETYEKITNLTSGKSIISAIWGADITQDSGDSIVKNFEKAQAEIDKIRHRYGGKIDSSTNLTSKDAETLKEQKALIAGYVEDIQPLYQQIDNSINAIEADEELASANKEQLAELKAMRDRYAEILGYTKDISDTSSSDGISGSIQKTNKGLSDTQKKLRDIERSEALTKLKYQLDQLRLPITKVDNALSLLNNTLDLTAENDYETKLYTTSRMLELAQQKSALLRDEFAQLDAQEYSSADTANEIATRMKSVADSIAETNKDIINYGKNIAEYYTSALTSVSSLSKTTIDEATNLLDRNIKSLSEGGLTGLQFNLSPTIPKSALDKQKEQNRSMETEMQSYYDTIAQMQKVALDLEYQEQMQSYAEQRAELDNTLNKSKTEIQKASKDIQTETKEFTNAEQTTLNNLHDWIRNNPLAPPALDSSWNDRVTEIEDWAKRVQQALGGISSSPWSDSVTGISPKLNSQKVLNTAAAFNGTPYVWGGSNLTDKGLDCSGYIYQVLKKLGYTGERTTADGFRKVGTKINKSEMQTGDLLFFDYGHDGEADHIGIYAGNGQMWHSSGNSSNTADNPGKGVHLADITSYYEKALMQVNRNPYVKAYAKGTKDYGNFDGIAGENNKPELLINKETGEITRIDSPTPIDTSKVDVMGEEDTARIEKHKYAKGTLDPMEVAKYIRSSYPEITDNAIAAILGNIYAESGFNPYAKTIEAYGGGDSTPIARWGLFQLDDTRIANWSNIVNSGNWQKQIDTALAEGRYQNSGMGSNSKYNMWQYITDPSKSASEIASLWDSLYERSSGEARDKRIDKANEYLKQMADSDLANNVSSIASDTSNIKADVGTRIKTLIEGRTSTTSTNTNIEDGLIAFVEENLVKTEGINDRLIDAFSAMATVDEEYKDKISSLIQDLKDNAETSNYTNIRTEMSTLAKDYANAITGEQVKYEAIAIKEQFDIAKQTQDLALQYFNQKKAEGATADELAVISEGYAEITNTMQEYSDKYVSIMSSYTDYLVSGADREMRAFNDRISWIDDANNDLQDVADNASSVAEKTEVWGKMIDNCNDKQALLADKMDKAHQEAENIRHSAEFAPIMEAFDTYAWFDADGNATAQFEADQMALSEVNPELVPLLNRAFELLQKYTQEWRSANDETKDNAKFIKNIQLEQANDKIELQAKVYDQINKRLDLRLNKEKAITNALQSHNSFVQSLRDAQLEYESELIANKHLETYLDPQAKELLFNDNDYSNIIAEMDSIQAEATKAYKKYQAEISKLGDEDYYKEQKLTEAYNQQVEKLKERLEVSKKELEVTKKQLEYKNTLKERDTRVILSGRTINIADPDKLYNVELAIAKSEKERDNILQDNVENQQVRNMEMESAVTQELISANNKYVETLQALDDDEKIRHAEQMASTDELVASLHALSTDYVHFLNDYEYNFRTQMASFSDIEWGNSYDYNYDHAEGQKRFWDMLLEAGEISYDHYLKMSNRNEDQRNSKVTSDPINSKYAPQTTEYGGKTYSPHFGINGDKVVSDYMNAKIDLSEDYSAAMEEIISKVNSQGGKYTQAEKEELQRLESLRNRKIFNEGLEYEQTNAWGGVIFGETDKYNLMSSSQKMRKFCEENAGLTELEERTLDITEYYGAQETEILNNQSLSAEEISEKLDNLHDDLLDALTTISRQSIADSNYDISNLPPVGSIAPPSSQTPHYASGTKHAKGGLAVTDEEGYEAKLREIQAGRYTLLKEEDMIFSAADTNKLWELVNNPRTFLSEQMKNMTSPTLPQINNIQNDNRSVVNNRFDFGGVVVEHAVDADDLVGSLVQKASSRSDITNNMRV